ncbi:translation initiation factor [Nostoc sp. HK-01]|uniref:Translation initiation factor n=1 Tax=Anabaenopsis circularis NIES-21 TaxID=1085406 RepID=A0A1Z4GNZ6_9CYAN|nr:translation initiation factor [Anabaenopsis circularis NIES-21]BBD62131.1 translation initiation factor [Nostoc sp. HK-01]
MVDGFFQKAKEFFAGSNNDEFEQDSDREVRPASEDPYGDPANQGYGDLTPASQDPYGDPADEYSNVSPASEDPYGDPADEYGR